MTYKGLQTAEWYVMLRRILFIIPLLAGRLLITIATFGGWGIESSKKIWKATR